MTAADTPASADRPELMTWSQRASRARGMPARTRRGRSTAPWSVGAAGSCEEETPAHLPVRAAYSRAAASTRSADRRPGGRPWRAASTPKPMIRTCPWWSTRTFSGTSRPCASPAACARARLSATSETIHAARRGWSGPSLASMTSSEVPWPHSLTTKHRSSSRSASRTRSRRGSRWGATLRAASRSPSARGSSRGMRCTATCRCRTESWARQKRPPSLSASRSSRR